LAAFTAGVNVNTNLIAQGDIHGRAKDAGDLEQSFLPLVIQLCFFDSVAPLGLRAAQEQASSLHSWGQAHNEAALSLLSLSEQAEFEGEVNPIADKRLLVIPRDL
jgi:hypothetical protein